MSELNGREAAREISDIGTTPMVGIAVRRGPISGIAISRDGSRLMVTNNADDSVSVIDTGTFRVVETVDGVAEPFAIAMGGSGTERAYVSAVATAYDSIQVIDTSTNAVVATHQLALSVTDLAVDRTGRHVYASRSAAGAADLAVLDTATGRVQAIDVADAAHAPGTTTECVCVSPDGTRAYVGTNGPAGGRLVVIGAKPQADPPGGHARWRNRRSTGQQTGWRVIDTVEIGLPVRDVALSPTGALAYVTSSAPEVGVVIDVVDTRTGKITTTHKVGETGGILTRMTLSADGDRAYLVSDDNVTVVCTLTYDVIATLGAGMQPSCVVESPDGKRLYIADYSGAVSVMPLASAAPLALESAAADSELSTAGWLLTDLVQHEPVLA